MAEVAEDQGLGYAVFSGPSSHGGPIIGPGISRRRHVSAHPGRTSRGKKRVRGQICPLCEHLLGRVFKVGSDNYHRFSPPVHPNCVHYWEYVASRSFANPDFRWPSAELISKHGFFVLRPARMRDLDIPKGVSAKDFRVINVADPERPGRTKLQVEWLRKQPGKPRKQKPWEPFGTVGPVEKAPKPTKPLTTKQSVAAFRKGLREDAARQQAVYNEFLREIQAGKYGGKVASVKDIPIGYMPPLLDPTHTPTEPFAKYWQGRGPWERIFGHPLIGPEHLRGLKGVAWTDGPLRQIVPEANFTWVAAYNPNDGTMAIGLGRGVTVGSRGMWWQEKDIVFTARHELGHNVWRNMLTKEEQREFAKLVPAWRDAKLMAGADPDRLWAYPNQIKPGDRRVKEFFAEAFTWRLDPDAKKAFAIPGMEKAEAFMDRVVFARTTKVKEAVVSAKRMKKLGLEPRAAVKALKIEGPVTGQDLQKAMQDLIDKKDIPPEHLVGVARLKAVVGRIKPLRPHKGRDMTGLWEMTGEGSHIQVRLDQPGGGGKARDKDAVKWTLAHEVGHHVWFSQVGPSDSAAWIRAHKALKELPLVGRTPVEGFAEAYAEFVLRGRFPKEYGAAAWVLMGLFP